MEPKQLERKLAAILYADVAGYSRLTGEDEEGTHRTLSAYLDTITTSIERHNGKVLHYAGDAMLAEFASVVNAVTCAVVIQRDLKARSEHLPEQRQVQFRIGINLGDVIVDRDEIYGDGVNVAARLESLAEPGGICISESVRTAVGNKLPLEYEFLGEQEVKNIAEPVKAYRVRLEDEAVPTAAPAGTRSRRRLVVASAAVIVIAAVAVGVVTWLKPWAPTIEPASEERMAFPLPDKPSIAVLPFTNMSDDAKQEYFVDGMTEDLITDLSKISGLFVIARNSVFTYKGKPVKVRQVAEELGIRYVLEGSVRRADNQVRINAQLIDATTGGHVWAERYDGSLDNVFAMQDKVTQKIVTALAVTLTTEEEATQARIETKNPKAYDAFLQGWEHYRRGTADDYAKAVSYFEQAIQRDPNYSRAHSALAAAYWNSYWNGWWKSLGLTYIQAYEQRRLSLEKAMEAPSALTHQVAAEFAAYFRRRPDKALAEAERAIALDANDPAGHLAMATALIKAGKPAEAVQRVQTAMRLDPHYPASYVTRLGQAQFAMGQYQDAAATLERAASRNPDDDWAFVYLAATYGHLDREKDAQAAVEKANVLRAKAGWGALTLLTVGHELFKWVGDRKALREGLRKAGVESGGDWVALVTTGPSGYAIKGATTIDVATAKALHDRGVPFVDVYHLWLRGHIPGTHYLDYWTDEFNEVRLLEIVDKNQEVVIYGSERGGGERRRAANACAQALTWGFEKVYYFGNGFLRWKAAGYPVEKSG